MGKRLTTRRPCLSREKVAIEEVKYFKEDIKQYDFEGSIHDELATSIRYMYMNRHSYNV